MREALEPRPLPFPPPNVSDGDNRRPTTNRVRSIFIIDGNEFCVTCLRKARKMRTVCGERFLKMVIANAGRLPCGSRPSDYR